MRGLVFALLGLAAMGACSVDAGANPGARCDEVTSCAAPRVCYRGFCVHGSDVPAIELELDAALTPANVGDTSAPFNSSTNEEAGAPPVTSAQTPAVSAAPDPGDAGPPLVGAPPIGVPPIAAPLLEDAAALPAAQNTTPPAPATAPPEQATTPPAQAGTPPAPVAEPAPPAAVPAVDPAPPPSAPSVPVTPPAEPPRPSEDDDSGDDSSDDDGSDDDDDDRGNRPGGGGRRDESPLLSCLPSCATRSVVCLVCLSGGVDNYAEVCDAKEQRRNSALRGLCEFLCSSLACDR